jgi:DNA-binding response OmpR family regulator
LIPNTALAQRILVIDDDAGMRSLMQRGLTLAGYAVETVAGGEAGIKAVKRKRPDLVLLDLMMPGLDGFATLELLSITPEPPKVIIFSGRDDPEDRRRLANANGFLTKPVLFDTLLESIQTVMASPLTLSSA